MSTPRVAIRADADSRIGLGHLSRCASLAEALIDLGATVTLIAQTPSPEIARYARTRGLVVRAIGSALDAVFDEQSDAQATCAVLTDHPCDVLVVDHYGLGTEWERAVRHGAPVLLAIDDIGRSHDADLLLDQNFGVGEVRPYDGRVPETCVQLLGERFALLPRVVRDATRIGAARDGSIARILVFFGGADHTGETAKALEALCDAAFLGWHVDVVSLMAGETDARVRQLAASRGRTTVHGLRPHLVDLMMRADLVIGAGGTSTWERLALGVPSLVTLVAENQRQAFSALSRAGAIHVVGEAARTTAQDYRAALQALPSPLITPPTLVDAWGATRVAARLLGERVPYEATVAAVAAVQDHLQVLVSRGGAPVGRVVLPAETSALAHVDVDVPDDYGPVLRAAVRALAQHHGTAAPFLQVRLAPTGHSRRLVILSDARSWLNAYLPALVESWLADGHAVCWSHEAAATPEGDLCFLLSWMQHMPEQERARFRRVLVVHESAVPHGRGMSPLTWQILEGRDEIPVTLLEAVDEVDAGDVVAERVMHFTGGELVEQLRRAQAEATIALCIEHVAQDIAGTVQRRKQEGEATYYPRRRPEHSALDPERTIAAQFDLLRVVDNIRYPAFFDWEGRRYVIRIQEDNRHRS